MFADRLMINQCFYHFKHLYKDLAKKKGGAAGGAKALEYAGPNFGNADMSPPTKGAPKDTQEMKDM